MSRTRFPKGISTAATSGQVTASYPGLDVTKTHEYFNDFDNYLAGDWAVTAVGTGAVAIADIDGGAITLTNSAGISDALTMTKLGVSFSPVAGNEMWFEARVKVSDATKSTVLVGLANVVTDPFTLANLVNGFFFNKPAAATAVDFYVRKDATTNSQKVTGMGAMADNTFIIFGVYYDGNNNFSYYLNDVKIGTVVTTAANFPGSAMTPIIAVKNGEAVAKVLTADYVFASKLR